MQHLGLEQIANELDLQGGVATLAAVGGSGEGAGQGLGQRLDGAVVEQDAREGSEPAAVF